MTMHSILRLKLSLGFLLLPCLNFIFFYFSFLNLELTQSMLIKIMSTNNKFFSFLRIISIIFSDSHLLNSGNCFVCFKRIFCLLVSFVCLVGFISAEWLHKIKILRKYFCQPTFSEVSRMVKVFFLVLEDNNFWYFFWFWKTTIYIRIKSQVISIM